MTYIIVLITIPLISIGALYLLAKSVKQTDCIQEKEYHEVVELIHRATTVRQLCDAEDAIVAYYNRWNNMDAKIHIHLLHQRLDKRVLELNALTTVSMN